MKITTKNILFICFVALVLFIIFHISISFKYYLDTDIALVYIEIINVAIIIVLTLQVYIYNKEKDNLDFKTKTPLVSISQEDDSGDYIIQNIGGGPALNVRALNDLDVSKKLWKKNIIAYDLFGNNSFKLDNSNKVQYLIIYDDIYENQYFSYMKDNKLLFGSITNENKVPSEVRILLQFNRNKEEFSNSHVPSV
jgi:hypothetical protein